MGNPSIKQKSCSSWRGWTNRQIILCMQMHTDMYIYTLVHSLMYVFTYCTYFFCVFNGWCLSLPLSVSLSLCVYIYTYLYTYIIYILCTFCQISNLRALHPEANLHRQMFAAGLLAVRSWVFYVNRDPWFSRGSATVLAVPGTCNRSGCVRRPCRKGLSWEVSTSCNIM